LGALPSFQENLSTLDMLRRQVACDPLPSHPLYEKRYPYLDRSLLEFLYAVPREQLVRPGQRRSLMRRSLAGIVPAEVLERERKASVGRAIVSFITAQEPRLRQLTSEMLADSMGIVDARRLAMALQDARQGHQVSLGSAYAHHRSRIVAQEFPAAENLRPHRGLPYRPSRSENDQVWQETHERRFGLS